MSGQLLQYVSERQWRRSVSAVVAAVPLTPYAFGAVGDGVTDDGAALEEWLATVADAALYNAPPLSLGTGFFRCARDLTLTMPANATGPQITGASGYNSTIAFDPGFRFQLAGSTPTFYSMFADFAITGNHAGPLVTFATAVGTDELNGAYFNIVVNNASANAAAIGVLLNGLWMSRGNIVANCAGPGNGTAIKIVAGAGNQMMLCGGNANVGLHMTSIGNANVGNNYQIDVEVNDIGLLIDHANVIGNTFGGIVTYLAASDIGIKATAGSANVIRKDVTYGGSGSLFGAGMANRVGLEWESRLQDFTTGLGVPASGGTVQNTSCQRAVANIYGGTVTAVQVNGVTVANTVPATAIVPPGSTLGLTYAVAPTVVWSAE